MASGKFARAVVAILILTAAARSEGPMPDDIAWKLIEMVGPLIHPRPPHSTRRYSARNRQPVSESNATSNMGRRS